MITVLFAILALLAVLWVAGPILEEKEPEIRPEESGTSEHDPTRVVLDQIADLDLEHAAGKIPEAAYKAVRADLAAQAAVALAATDVAKGDAGADGASGAATAVAQPASSGAASGKASKSSGSAAAGFCPGCGKKAPASDKFCAHCGHKLRG